MVVVATGTAVSVAANTKSAEQVAGQFQYSGKGTYRLACRASATGLNVTFAHGGISPINDLAIPFTGTAGAISKIDHEIVTQSFANEGRNELTFRNSTGGALTVDYILEWFPSK